MPTVTGTRATVEDLYRVDGKAELINGRIVKLMATGLRPNRVAGRIFRSLDDHSEQIGRGLAFTDNMGFTVDELASGRESFSPDASWYDGPLPENPMRFIHGAPKLAVEVRSESDYGETAEEEMAEKRSDYFEAGSLVVWDVDPVDDCIHCYRRDDAENPVTFRRGETADAEPAVPGWRVDVDWIFG